MTSAGTGFGSPHGTDTQARWCAHPGGCPSVRRQLEHAPRPPAAAAWGRPAPYVVTMRRRDVTCGSNLVTAGSLSVREHAAIITKGRRRGLRVKYTPRRAYPPPPRGTARKARLGGYPPPGRAAFLLIRPSVRRPTRRCGATSPGRSLGRPGGPSRGARAEPPARSCPWRRRSRR